jgi:Uma2 family endonuclease
MTPVLVQEAGTPPPDFPEDVLYEIVDGKYEELPPMSTYAVIIASRLARKLGDFAESQQLGEVVSEMLFGLTPRSRRKHRPDVAFVSYQSWARNRPWPNTDPWPVVPELAIEVVSPNDLAESVQTKVQEYLDAGVNLVWVVYPNPGWVHVYESPQRLRGLVASDSLDGGSVLPGFTLPLAELFTQPAEPPGDGEKDAPTAGQGD